MTTYYNNLEIQLKELYFEVQNNQNNKSIISKIFSLILELKAHAWCMDNEEERIKLQKLIESTFRLELK